MEEVISNFSSGLLEAYKSFVSTLPSWAQSFISFFLLVLLIVIYSIIVWKGYRFIAKKDPLRLNLAQYNKSKQSFNYKLKAGVFYFLEYLVISPIIIFIGFSVFTVLLIFLAEGLELQGVLLVSAAIVMAIRMASYYKEDLAREIAKFLPFTLLALSVINPQFFNIERIFAHLNEIPMLFGDIGVYLFFIIILEAFLRFFEFIFSLFNLGGVVEEGAGGK